MPPKLVQKVEPEFPKECRKVRFDGTLFMFEAIISERGEVLDIKTIRRPEMSKPCVAVEDAFRQAIGRWKYEPATLAGRPVRVYLTVTANIEVR